MLNVYGFVTKFNEGNSYLHTTQGEIFKPICRKIGIRIELITEKTTLIWICTSWKQLSNYIISQVQVI